MPLRLWPPFISGNVCHICMCFDSICPFFFLFFFFFFFFLHRLFYYFLFLSVMSWRRSIWNGSKLGGAPCPILDPSGLAQIMINGGITAARCNFSPPELRFLLCNTFGCEDAKGGRSWQFRRSSVRPSKGGVWCDKNGRKHGDWKHGSSSSSHDQISLYQRES